MVNNETAAARIFEQNREFFSGLAQAAPQAGLDVEPCLLDTGTTIAFFGGAGNPLTQANGRFTPDDIASVGEFFRGRTPEWEALITPFAHTGALDRLYENGASLAGWESVLVRDPLESLAAWEWPDEVRFEKIGPGQRELWIDISTRSFFSGGVTEGVERMNRLLRCADNVEGYLGYWNDQVAAAASVTLSQGSRVDFLGGMGTLPEFRGRGLQTAAIRRRLEDLSKDVEIVTIGATPGSSSHRNAERAGFRIAYSQLSVRVPTG